MERSLDEPRNEKLTTRTDMADTICLDQICFLKYVYVSECIEFHQSNDSDCILPCKVDTCAKTFHYDSLCPMWFCEPMTTTTSSTSTTTGLTTFSTTSNYSPDDSLELKLQVSFAFNIFFCVIACVFFIVCKRTICSFCGRLRRNFQSNWSSENENIPLQQRTSFATFHNLSENRSPGQPHNVTNEMFFSIVSDSEQESSPSGFSEIILNDPDSIELAIEQQNISEIFATSLSKSSPASEISEQPKVSFLRKTLMRAAKSKRIKT